MILYALQLGTATVLKSKHASLLRRRLLGLSFFLFALLFLILVLAIVVGGVMAPILARLLGASILVLGIWIGTFLLECFSRSITNGVSSAEENLAVFLYRLAPETDLVAAFLKSEAGIWTLERLAIDKESIESLCESRIQKKEVLPLHALTDAKAATTSITDIISLAALLIRLDSSLSHFLATHGVTEVIFISVLKWYTDSRDAEHEKSCWWSRARLLAIPSFGRLWAYGGTYHLDRYAHDLTDIDEASAAGEYVGRREELERILETLAKAKESNVMIVASPGEGSDELLSALAFHLRTGAIGRYGGMRLLSFDGTAFLAQTKGKDGGEKEFRGLLKEASLAGNVILAIKDFASLLSGTRRDGMDISALLDPYLASGLPIIAVADPAGFHALIEPDPELMRRFEKLSVVPATEEELLQHILRDITLAERAGSPNWSYGAALALVRATRYFGDSAPQDKIKDLFLELIPIAVRAGSGLILERDVNALVQAKTHISVGTVEGPEKEKLVNLEKLLHERVIGQDEGIAAIARAMRRARAGVQNVGRPMGSFLFLGPTGVGKTETAKALASVFFGSGERMVRLDMSEYQDDGSVTRLIGSFESGKPGTFTSLVRDNPYGVVLVDEFEKASQEVRRLFLQILEEGRFADMAGKPVSLRNNIIIATSNAVADRIFTLVQGGARLEDHRDELINEIVSRGIYAPELLNRFDAVVFYRSLTQVELAQVAKLMLGDLQKQLAQKGITFIVNDIVIRTAMKYGNDQKFGARPMRRAIADHIEDIIARRIIEGSVKAGDTVNLTEADLLR